MKKFVVATLALGLLVFSSVGASQSLSMDEPPEPTSEKKTLI